MITYYDNSKLYYNTKVYKYSNVSYFCSKRVIFIRDEYDIYIIENGFVSTSTFKREVAQVVCGTDHTVIRTTDNCAFAQGSNILYQCGLDNNTTYYYDLTEINLQNVTDINCDEFNTVLICNRNIVYYCGGYRDNGLQSSYKLSRGGVFTKIIMSISQADNCICLLFANNVIKLIKVYEDRPNAVITIKPIYKLQKIVVKKKVIFVLTKAKILYTRNFDSFEALSGKYTMIRIVDMYFADESTMYVLYEDAQIFKCKIVYDPIIRVIKSKYMRTVQTICVLGYGANRYLSWKPEIHSTFPKYFHDRIYTLLLCIKRYVNIPKYLKYMIFQFAI